MPDRPLYRLADSTVVEPLVDSWSAWSHVLAPIPSSLHLRNYQVELLRSYLEDPETHAEACQDPRLRSGRLVDIPAERAAEVEALLARTEAGAAENLQLAAAVTEFHDQLVREARGQSLEPFYARLPDRLRGYTELVYDYYNRPTARFYENLLYESAYYRRDRQSFRIFTHASDRSRPFFMNTPRLHQDGDIDWARPFDSPEVDQLFRLDSAPAELGAIRELLGLTAHDEPALRLLLTDRPRPPRAPWTAPEARIRYFGHACLLVEWGGISILTDPYVPAVPTREGTDRFTYADLPETIDYVVVTHNHHDHFCLETLLRLRHRLRCLVVPRSSGMVYGDLSLKLLARKLGFQSVIELDALETIELPGGAITAVPFLGEHADLAHGKAAYAIRAGDRPILVAADSNCLDRRVYDHVRRAIGAIDTLFLGMECVGAPLSWSCGPFFPVRPDVDQEQSRRYKGSDAAAALAMAEAIGARQIILYAMGLEPWLEYLLGLALTGDSEQLQQARLLLSTARQKGLASRLLAGKAEIDLR